MYWFIATFGGVGYAKKAPGTWGSLAAVPFAAAVAYLGGFSAMFLTAVVLYFAGAWSVGKVTGATGDLDPQQAVIDEVVGVFVTLLPFSGILKGSWSHWWLYPAAFVLFRVFDILKPWPVGWIDRRIRNAHGVMLDDVAAGVMAAAVLYLAGLFI